MTDAAELLDVGKLTGSEARALIRARRWRGPTVSMAQGWAQANLVALPVEFAASFRRFCELNSQACPLLDVTAVGSPVPTLIASDADLRTDIPRYCVYRGGVLAEEREDLIGCWGPDLVGFLLGCSFTFEAALMRGGIPMRHLELGMTVPMYKTNRECHPAGPFHGPLVVTMRPIPADLVERAITITSHFTRAHGAPVHVGDPAVLDIADLNRPDWADPLPLRPDDVPVFWACGVTPQAAAAEARLDLMITHAPAHMFITDLCDESLSDGAL